MQAGDELGLDVDRLGRWLDANSAPGAGERPVLQAMSGGTQNALFLIERGPFKMVMRMPTNASDVERCQGLLREMNLLRALRGTGVPHAELIAADETSTVFGRPFYVMENVDGWSPAARGWPEPFNGDADARRDLAFALIDGAASLARIDWQRQGLENFGRPDSFHERQVERWLAFSTAHRVRDLPGLTEAAAWLFANRPRSYVPGIMHGDYQFLNVIYSHDRPTKVSAIVDWEMTTVGDPLLDVAWALLDWDGNPFRETRRGFWKDVQGMPTCGELIERYESLSGRPVGNFHYYSVLARWKLGIVLEKTYAASQRRGGQDHEAKGASASFGPIVVNLIQDAYEMTRMIR